MKGHLMNETWAFVLPYTGLHAKPCTVPGTEVQTIKWLSMDDNRKDTGCAEVQEMVAQCALVSSVAG